MGQVAVRNVETVVLPLLTRAVSIGALLGGCLSAGVTGYSAIQAALYPEQFGLWGWNVGQIFFMTMVGAALALAALGLGAGLASGAGLLAAAQTRRLIRKGHSGTQERTH